MKAFDTRSTSERAIIDFTPYGLPGITRLGRYAYKHAHPRLETHTHEGMMEICYCDKGLQLYEVAGRPYQVKGGDVFVTFPGEPHSTSNHPEEKGVLYWLIVQLPADGPFLQYNDADGKAFVKELLAMPARHFRGNPSMKKWLDDIFTLHHAGRQPMHRLRIMHLLTTFLLSVMDAAAANAGSAHSDRMTSVKKYIADHIYDDLTIELLAREAHISDSHFKSWFKKEMGMPPLDYILRERIEEGKKILRENRQANISQIAYALNFSSPQYFATVFKKYAGVSPVEFKNSR